MPGQMTLAEVDFALGFYDRAEPTLRKILQARPKNSAATLLLVDLLINTERQSEAVTLLRQKIRLYSDPDFVARLQELTGAGSVSLMGLATGGGTQMLRPGAERQARRRPDAARTVNTVAPTPLSETPQAHLEPQTAEGAVR